MSIRAACPLESVSIALIGKLKPNPSKYSARTYACNSCPTPSVYLIKVSEPLTLTAARCNGSANPLARAASRNFAIPLVRAPNGFIHNHFVWGANRRGDPLVRLKILRGLELGGTALMSNLFSHLITRHREDKSIISVLFFSSGAERGRHPNEKRDERQYREYLFIVNHTFSPLTLTPQSAGCRPISFSLLYLDNLGASFYLHPR